MFPSSHHQKQEQQIYGGYGGCGANYYNNENFSGLVMSQLEKNGHVHNQYGHNDQLVVNGFSMAEDESRTNSLNNDPELPGSNSKHELHHRVDDEDQVRDEGWLQLSVGGRTSTSEDVQPRQGRSSSGSVELDLLQSSPSSRQFQASRSSMPPMFHVPDHDHNPNPNQIRFPNLMSNTSSSSLYFHHPLLPPSFPQHHQISQEVNWGLIRPLISNHRYINNYANGSRSTSSSNFIQMGPSTSTSYFPHPFQLQHHYLHHGGVAAGRLDFRVVDPPRRPQSGIWFMLQASQNQYFDQCGEKELFLPQIPKRYLRIKDGRMTVRLIKKYVVNKLRLDNESEVEITCRGQQLQPSLTLQYVRDNVWSQRDADAALTLLPLSDFSCNSTSTDDHVMVLHYARMSSSSTARLD